MRHAHDERGGSARAACPHLLGVPRCATPAGDTASRLLARRRHLALASPGTTPNPNETDPVTLAEVLTAERRRENAARARKGEPPLSLAGIGRACGTSASRIREVFDGTTRNPGLLTVIAVLGALGRDLAWLARQLAK